MPTDNPSVKHDSFNTLKPARVSQDLYEFDKVRYKMDVYPFRLLMMISQAVSKKGELDLLGFVHEWPVNTIFQYLGIEKDGRRYEKLNEAFEGLLKNGLSLKQVKPNGATRWVGITFISKYEFAMDYPGVRVTINPEAKQFLSNLAQYTRSLPTHYLKLSTEYQNWFYPYLKNVANLGKWEVKIEDLKFMLYLDKTASYTTDPNANRNFFERVLGITKPKGSIKPNAPWDYIRKPNGEFGGTLFGISSGSDIKVTAYPRKSGRSYTHIIFNISFHSARLTKFDQDKIQKKATENDILDMGKAEPRKRNRKADARTMADLFSNLPVMEMVPNPIHEKVPEVSKTIIQNSTMVEMAKLQNITPEVLANKLGYTKNQNNEWEK